MEIISQHISCVVLPGELPAAIEEGYNEIYVMTSSGIIKHHKLRGQNRFVRLKVEKLPANYKEVAVSQQINFLPGGHKIPIELFDQVVTFFKQVMEVKKAELEAMIWVCWSQDEGYHLIVPDQRVSKASASYDWASLPAGKTIVCDIHSHNTMGAFFSGTDNRDDQGNIGFSGVVGRLDQESPMTVWRFNYKDTKVTCEFDDIFVLPAREEQVVPEDWISKIVTTSAGYQGGNSPKGKADHLAPWQYTKGQGAGEGNRVGPHMKANNRGSLPADAYGNSWSNIPERSDSPGANGAFAWDNWALDPNDIDADGLTAGMTDERASYAERALAVLREDPDYNTSHLGGGYPTAGVPGLAEYNPDFDPDNASPFADDNYIEVKDAHGKDVADIYSFIEDGMSVLNGKDELVQNLMQDMIHMMSEEGQEEFFKAFYQELPQKAQERIQMNGIH